MAADTTSGFKQDVAEAAIGSLFLVIQKIIARSPLVDSITQSSST
jgi:hypothetical protein